MLCAQCQSEVIDLNGVCPKCGAELVKSGEDSARIVQNVSGGVTLSADEQINVQGDTVGRDKIEVRNDYSVANTIYQFNLTADNAGQLANEPRRKGENDSKSVLPKPSVHSQIIIGQKPPTSSQTSSLFKIVSPILVSTDRVWRLPSIGAIFGPSDSPRQQFYEDEMTDNIRRIEMILSTNDAPAKIIEIQTGPTITRYCMEPGYRQESEVIDDFDDISVVRVLRTQIDDIRGLQNQVAAAFDLPVRVVSYGLGRSYVGIEIPNRRRDAVPLRNVIRINKLPQVRGQLRIGIGENSTDGTAIVDSLENMRHLSISGISSSGKSTCIRTVLTTLLMKNTPNDLRLVMIDPSGTHFHEYIGLPHLLIPVITNKYMAVEVLEKMLVEMEARYDSFTKTNVRTVFEYDSIIAKDNRCLPSLVIIVENLSNLIEVDYESVERMLIDLTEKGHNVGMHLVVSSQAPLKESLIQLLGYCFPAKYVLALNSAEESVSILGQAGAECLLKQGDMLVARRPYSPNPQRVQGAAVAFDELTLLLNYWKIQSEQGKS